METELTIIIPAYNEEKSIEKTILLCHQTNPQADILIINDNSKDRTAEIAGDMKRKIKELEIISHKKNMGYGAALITGFSEAKTPYIAFLDADLTYHPKYIPPLLETVKNKGLDCAWGSRFSSGSNRMPLIRKIGNRALVILFFLVTRRYIPDVSSGERLFRKESLDKISYRTLPPGLDIITAITKRIASRKFRFSTIPIEYSKRSGSSKLNVITDFIRMCRNIIMEK